MNDLFPCEVHSTIVLAEHFEYDGQAMYGLRCSVCGVGIKMEPGVEYTVIGAEETPAG